MKAQALVAVLRRAPLSYSVARQSGSHRKFSSENYPPVTFSYHDGVTVPPGVVRKILVGTVGLSEEEALGLL
jgi:predicted RNA binding protein YcfA (HicA-like mRNA interferase family)